MTRLALDEFQLFDYQKRGIGWLASRKVGLLADEMGLGKTVQVIRACDEIGAKRVLILCPAAVRVNWLRELKKFSSGLLRLSLINSRRVKLGPDESAVCSYDLADGLLKSNPGKFDVLVLDEGHYLKSKDTVRTRAVFGREGLVRLCDRTWMLSGTPTPNHPGELWPMLFTFGATRLSYEKFVREFCECKDEMKWVKVNGQARLVKTFQIFGAKIAAIPALKQILSTVMLRRKKSDVNLELPPITFQSIVVERGPVDLTLQSSFVRFLLPTDRRRELVEELERERAVLETTLEATGRGIDGIKALEALASSLSTLRMYTGLQKVQPVVDLVTAELEDLAYEKIVIFAVHRDVIEALRLAFTKFGVVTLYGRTNPVSKQKNIDRFQNDPKCRVFAANIQAAGTGITLTAADQVLFLEQDWVPGNNAQAAMRCHRIGQTRPVSVRFVGLADSVDEKVAAALRRKARELTEIFDT